MSASRILTLCALSGALLCCNQSSRAGTSKQKKSASSPRWEAADDSAAAGSTFKDDDFIFTVESRRTCDPTPPFLPKAGQIRLSLGISVKARTERLVPVSPLSFVLEDPEGHIFPPTLAGCSPTVKPRKLKGDDQVEGEVAFDVPGQAGKLDLIFEPFLLGRQAVRARVRVPSVANTAPEAKAAPEAPR